MEDKVKGQIMRMNSWQKEVTLLGKKVQIFICQTDCGVQLLIAGGDRNRLQLFPDVFQKYFKALRGKPEISEDDGGNPEKACFLEIPACTAQNLPYLQMPWLQTENPCAQGAR